MDKINFTVNGERYFIVGTEVSPTTSLNDYLRNYLQLFGTKAMCHEGGCGACVVSVSHTHPRTKEKHVFSVNSCLVHILSCHDWDITTIEGVGNRRDGYHAVQRRLAAFNGTQCGYCSPGMVMNMYSLSQSTSKLTMQQVENSFGSNICRCTGYRPIMDAFKSFATDLDPELKNKIQDMEDLDKMKCIKSCKKDAEEDGWCVIQNEDQRLKDVAVQGARWYKAFTIGDVFKVLNREGSDSYKLVAGNTGQGVYFDETEARVFIDISSIDTLKDYLLDENLVIGAGMTLTDVMALFKSRYNRSEFLYLQEFYKHLDLVAHVPVRNIGTVGGNLAMKNAHHEFPSDVFLLLLTVGAGVTLMDSKMSKTILKTEDFLATNLKNNLILNVKLPPLSERCLVRTFKIMPRAQNSHAIVNAGFFYQIDSVGKIVSANLVFGNISSNLHRAKQTAKKLEGMKLFSDETLQKGLRSLKEELVPVDQPPDPSPETRKTLALGLFYKGILSLHPDVNPRYKTGGVLLQRGISQGTQSFDTDKSLWPLNKPVQKLEGLTQCSGEVKYACDITTEPKSVQVAFVQSEIYRGEIESIDASEALKLNGVIAFYSAKDIPGKNNFTPNDVPWMTDNEEIFATTVSYYGQPIGVIAAMTRRLAFRAVSLVKVKYKKSEEKIVLNVTDALVAPDKERRVRQDSNVKPSDRGIDVDQVIKGSVTIPSQYHFTMETQSCTVSNTSRGVLVRSATQWMDLVNVAVGDALAIDHNCVEVVVPRVGGAYGGKASRSALVACACAVVAYKLNRTATLVLPITDNMTAIGMRQHCEADYEIGINKDGLIQYIDLSTYSDCGWSFNDTSDLSDILSAMYNTTRWGFKGYSVLTDKPGMTWCRGPGKTEIVAIAEHIMERIAFETNKDPIDIRFMHLSDKNQVVKDIVDGFKNECDFNDRKTEIEKFNKENAWKKKGLKLSIMEYALEYSWNFPVTISVYHVDGTVTMSHGGIEMGQGLNTKVAQVCAYTLKIPLEKVTVKGSDNFTSPNAMCSNGSITSDSLAFATVKACEELLKRLDKVKKGMDESKWEDVVKAAFNKGINLQTSYMMSEVDKLEGYSVYGVCTAEVELDVLTGTHIVRRVDILEDTGISMSPDIDVGQIEGAFIMGLGLWTTENLIYDASGRLLTDRTWTYKPPGCKDIPEDFRISFRRNAPNPTGVLRSKATGEPAIALAVVIKFALHEAVFEARKEFGYKSSDWVPLDAPCTVENILKAISPSTDYYKLK